MDTAMCVCVRVCFSVCLSLYMYKSPNLNEVADDSLPVVTKWLHHHLLELVMIDSYDLGERPTSDCKRLWDIKHHGYFSCHASGL